MFSICVFTQLHGELYFTHSLFFFNTTLCLRIGMTVMLFFAWCFKFCMFLYLVIWFYIPDWYFYICVSFILDCISCLWYFFLWIAPLSPLRGPRPFPPPPPPSPPPLPSPPLPPTPLRPLLTPPPLPLLLPSLLSCPLPRLAYLGCFSGYALSSRLWYIQKSLCDCNSNIEGDRVQEWNLESIFTLDWCVLLFFS